MRPLLLYTDTSVIGGCEDPEFATESRALWERFSRGEHTLVLSAHTIRELGGAPEPVRRRLDVIPDEHVLLLPDLPEAFELAEGYLQHGIVGVGARADALHVALATVGGADVVVSWNFRHIVNLGRIRMFNAVNLERGHRIIEIRSPREVLYE